MPDQIIKGTNPHALPTRFKEISTGVFAQTTVDAGGQAGVTVTTNTTAVTGAFTAIQVLEDAVFSTFTETGATGQTMTGFTIPAGVTLFGRVTAYTLTSGKVRAYA